MLMILYWMWCPRVSLAPKWWPCDSRKNPIGEKKDAKMSEAWNVSYTAHRWDCRLNLNALFIFFIFLSLSIPFGPSCGFVWTYTGDGHEEQPFVTDKKENDLSGYERNLYLYHVSTINSTFICFFFHPSIRFESFSVLLTVPHYWISNQTISLGIKNVREKKK